VQAGGDGAANVRAPGVSCVVINWNGWKDTATCVEALLKQDYPSLQIVIVDNASTDDSAERIRAAFPQIDFVQASENGGFAAGSNLGIKRALAQGSEFLWLLNNDTIAPPDTVRKLVAAAADPRVGIVGTVLRYMHEPAKIQAWGGGSIRPWMGFVRHYDSPTELERNSFVTFASVLLRTEMLEQVGLLDEHYFMYFEDADLCFRARAAGWKLAVAGDTSVMHKEGGSGSAKSARVDRIVTASGLRFLNRYGESRRLAKFLFVVTRLGKRLAAGKPKRMRAVMRGVRDWRRNETLGFLEER
jgi:GT2 family glycosyltransferase